jgi:hypothetical protein
VSTASAAVTREQRIRVTGRAIVPRDAVPSAAWRAAATGAITIGVAIRLVLYAHRTSLWLDESMIALNIGSRGFVGLTRPLDFDQAASIPFLWATKLATLAFGMNEWSLRLVPLLASLALLVLFWRAARSLVGEEEALLATTFAACSMLLITYSAEVKQYGIDGFVTAAILALATPVLTDVTRAARWRYLAIGGGVALCCSMPAVFTLAGISAALVADRRIRDDPTRARHLVIMTAGWSLLFALLYFFVYRSTVHSAYLGRFWQSSFLTLGLPDTPRRIANGLYQTFFGPFVTQIGVPETKDALFLVGTGVWVVGVAAAGYTHRVSMALLLAVPYLACFAASVVGRYPMAGRMLLFATPLLYLAGASTVLVVVDHWPRRWRRFAYWALLLGFAVMRVNKVARLAIHPISHEESRDFIHDLDQRTGHDPVYVFASGVPAWLFYTTDWQSPDTARLRWYASVASSTGRAFANAPSRGMRSMQDGDGLTYNYHGREEIVGVGDGMEYQSGVRFLRPQPDPGWAATEAARIRAASRPTVSLYASHFTAGELHPLLAAIRDLGGGVEFARTQQSAVLYRIRF